MKSLLFILNPTAGGGTASELEDMLTKCMKDYDLDYEIVLTTRPKEATEIVENSDREYMIAVGGDGTINEVAQGIIARGYGSLGIIPGGTGNDLSRSLGIPMDAKKALAHIIEYEPQELDICMANGRYFFNIASIGFDAQVVKNAEKIKLKTRSEFSYIISIFYTLLKFKRNKVEIEIDGKRLEKRMVLLSVGNGSYYGGGVKILPQASLNDGYLHSCLIYDANNLLVFFLLPTILNGSHLKIKKYVDTIKAKNIKIRSKNHMYFNLDGEILSGGKEVEFKLEGTKLPVIYPRREKN